MKVIIQDLLHQKVEIRCKPTEKVFHLRMRLHEKHKVDPNCYFLTFGEVFLDNEDILEKLKIVKGSVIYIYFRAWAVEPDVLEVPSRFAMGVFAEKNREIKEH